MFCFSHFSFFFHNSVWNLIFRFQMVFIFLKLFQIIFQTPILIANSNSYSSFFSISLLISCSSAYCRLTFIRKFLIHNHSYLSTYHSLCRFVCTLHMDSFKSIACFWFKLKFLLQVQFLFMGKKLTFQSKTHNHFWITCSVSRFISTFQTQSALTVHNHFHSSNSYSDSFL